MPWTINDVDKFKKGLTLRQKRQWVQAANSALRTCMLSKGRSENTCAASAIRQANGVVGNVEMYMYVNTAYEVERTEYEGRQYLVVPVVMIKEGVHNGSAGAVFHSEQLLANMPQGWNGIPIMVYHPQDSEGYFVSANSPDTIKERVGTVFNTRYENGLRADAYLDEEKLKQVSPDAYDHIINRLPLDVSLGMYTEDSPRQGQWHDEQYESIAENYRPDHLALLPGETGACSWGDGCGVRINSNNNNNNKGGETKMPNEVNTTGKQMVAGFVSVNKGKEEVHIPLSSLYESYVKDILELIGLETNQSGYRELLQTVQQKLDSMDNDMKTHYLQELYDGYIVYECRKEGGSSLNRQNYSVNTDGSVELTGDPVGVRKEISYVTLAKKKTTINNNDGGKKMPKNKDGTGTPCCQETVKVLIANKQTRFTEDDREWLMTLSESELSKLFPLKNELAEPPQVNESQVKGYVEKALKSDDFVTWLPDEYQEQMRSGLALHKAKKKALIDKIITNSDEGTWTEKELEAYAVETLEKIGSFVKEPVDYSMRNGGGTPPASNELAAGDVLTINAGIKIKEGK